VPVSEVVAVVGAGNVGCALAADLVLRGVEVRLCTRSEERLALLRAAGAITVTGAVVGLAPLPLLTTSVGEAVAAATTVAVTVPTPALPYYAPALVAHCTSRQLLWLNPGHSGGALYIAAEFGRAGLGGIRICQLSTASHGSRMTSPGQVGVFRLPKAVLAAFPGSRIEECFEQVDSLLPGQFSCADTVLELDLMNINAVMHPAQMVGNASWIEATAGDFNIYQEGTGAAVGRIMDGVDIERLATAERLGVPAVPFVEILRQAGFTTAEGARLGGAHEALRAAEPIREVKAPPSLDHRYLHEDVGWGLVPWTALATAVGVHTPTMDALIQLAGVVNEVDYQSAGLDLERMGLAGMTPRAIVEFVRTGR
jgi:opine dehydrogenase